MSGADSRPTRRKWPRGHDSGIPRSILMRTRSRVPFHMRAEENRTQCLEVAAASISAAGVTAMRSDSALDTVGALRETPRVRSIGVADLNVALARGIDDFNAKPSHILFLRLLYPIVCLIASRLVVGRDVLPLTFPLLAGMTLLGPLAAVGLYEISRRREQ